jgi:outer membrane protein OmpA-like peptidoglycan-associated protein
MASQGVQSARLLIAGRGESQPIASNATPEGRARNRRVEIQISPITQ